MQPIQTLKKLKQLTVDYYGSAHMAHHTDKFIAYVNAFTPVELLYAMDVIPIYPENHAVILGARHLSVETAQAAEGMGYSGDLCSYARCDLGSIKTGISPTWGLPKPDLLVISNSQCGTLTKWFEVLSRKYHAPMFLIDVPHTGRGERDIAGEQYVRGQLEDLVTVVEGITRRSLDWDRLREVIRLSRDASNLWIQVLEVAKNAPTPITVFDQFISMAPIVAQRGTPVAVEFYRELVAELNDRVQKGIGAIENERFRLFWDNLPIWPQLRSLSALLEQRGAALVTSLYTWAWANLAVGEEDPFRDWTEQYLYTANLHIEKRIQQYVDIAHQYRLDGFLYHSNRSCKFVSQDIPEVKKAVSERTSIPGLIIEADHNDPRRYSLESLKQQIESFIDFLGDRR